MTVRSTIEWMKREGYYSIWLLPQLGLNKGTPYDGRPIGNSPKIMPLENTLNNDAQISLCTHCAVTAYLPDRYPAKFSMQTPLTIASAISRLYFPTTGNVPSSKQIVENCNKLLCAIGVIYENKGRMVPEMSNRMGHRNHAAGRNREGWGGIRVKGEGVHTKMWLHPDALLAKNMKNKELLQVINLDEFSDNLSEGESDTGE